MEYGPSRIGFVWPSAGNCAPLLIKTMRLLLCPLLVLLAVIQGLGEEQAWRELPVDEPGLHGRLFYFEGRPRPTFLVLGGSEGGLEGSRNLAARLADLGCNAFSLAYFGTPETPPALIRIPLEGFCQGLDWLERQPFATTGALGVAGGSKGAEAALLVAGLRPELRVAVAFLPTHVVWQGIDEVHDTVASSWTWQGQELPFVPYIRHDAASLAMNYGWETVRDLHLASLAAAKPDVVQRALIPVDNTRAALLLFSGENDQVWPSTMSGKDLEKRGREASRPVVVRHFKYPSAGHSLFDGTIDGGGDAQANREAQADAIREMKAFLKEYLSGEAR